MTLTAKQKKLFWLCAAILIAAYFAPSLLTNARRPDRTSGQAMQNVPGGTSSSPNTFAAIPFRDLMGQYNGRALLPARGICNLRLELRLNREKSGAYSGYSTLTCAIQARPQRLNWMPMNRAVFMPPRPTSAILTGVVDSSALRFTVEDIISVAGNCIPTSYTVRRFGANQIAVQWIDSCRGGAMLLNRTGR